MKSAVLARPNLKAFLLGAILIAVVQNFIANGNSPGSVVHARGLSGTEASATDLQRLLQEAQSLPNSQLYARISRFYEKQGDLRKALFYFRKSQILAQLEEAED